MKTMDFAEILDQMIEKSYSEPETSHHPSHTQTPDPAYVSALISQISASIPVFKYHSAKSYTSHRHSKAQAPTAPFQLRSMGMSVVQFKAYETIFYALELPVLKAHQIFPEGFSPLQLKKAFKIAALKRHPDTGGSHESFLELKKSYELLLEFVKTKTV